MAVEARWISTLDKEQKLFVTKAEADAHDKKIALVEGLADFIDKHYEGKNKPDESVLEEIAMVLANNKDIVAKAMKGKPDILYEEQEASGSADKSKAKAA